MKKIIKSAFVLAIMALTFTSCEDVPAPFDTNYNEQGEPSNVEPAGDGTEASPYNVARALEIIKAGEQTTDMVYLKGVITNIKEIDTNQFGNATFSISDTKNSMTKFLIYRSYGLDGQKFTTGNEIAVGDTVVVQGILINFNGTPETQQGAKIVSINGKGDEGSGGEENPGGETPGGLTIEGTTVTAVNSEVTAGTTTATIDLSTLALEKGAEVTTVNLSDGSTITFGKGTNETNMPVFYPATKGVRVYANNEIKFACKSNIAKIVFTCDRYNNIDQVGNPTATMAFDGKNATYTNTHTASSGGIQLRVQTITITYAK